MGAGLETCCFCADLHISFKSWQKNFFKFTLTCILHPMGGVCRDDFLCRYGYFIHFSAKSCIRQMATLPDGGGVAKPEFLLILDIKCNFQQTNCDWTQAHTLEGKSFCHSWRVSFHSNLEGKTRLVHMKLFLL